MFGLCLVDFVYLQDAKTILGYVCASGCELYRLIISDLALISAY